MDLTIAGRKSLFLLASFLLLAACDGDTPRSGTIDDEAKRAGLSAAHFKPAVEDYFRAMDGGVALTAGEIEGRNTWLVWTAGNDKLWDTLSVKSLGSLDFLKVLSSHPRIGHYGRDRRWSWFGLVNEPCFDKATAPDKERFGLWLDKRRGGDGCGPDPFENEAKYPGVAIGARGKTVPVGSYYGYATGIVGLRLFPNPDFDEKAARRWDPVRYYEDPSYYLDKDLVKPYRVGMSCAFCHVGPNPVKPPADPENPKWENLSSNVGAQYFWIDRIFVWDSDESSFVWQLFHTSRPGALDTSLVSTDNINNPRTMNAIYQLGPRLAHGLRWGKETLGGGGLNNRQFNDYVSGGPLLAYYKAPDTVFTPRVLKDGSDSVGALGALNRVYLNIGLFSEEWLTHFNALVGGKETTPIEIAVARERSAYWGATESQTANMALFFLKASAPHKLRDAPGGDRHLTKDKAVLTRGKEVFAGTCARCHSSKMPPGSPDLDAGGGCSGSNYLACFDRYWQWTRTDEFRRQMREIVLADDFLEGNYLSSELRIPATLLKTNACSALATNAIRGNIWDNFSSQTYKELPAVGKIVVYHPVTGEASWYEMPGGGRGYTRPASLVSAWSTAPFFLNNSLGDFDPSPSVDARMRSFQSSIEQLLWPEKRVQDSRLGSRVPGMMDRTTRQSFLRVPNGYVPDLLQPLLGSNGIEIGPIPTGTAVNLLAGVDLLAADEDVGTRVQHKAAAVKLLLKAKVDLAQLPKNADDETARRVLGDLVDPLFKLAKCPDYVVNRGHYFGTGFREPQPGDEKLSEAERARLPGSEPALSDDDKRALIEFVKTF